MRAPDKCSRCRRRDPRPGLRTCAVCTAEAAERERREHVPRPPPGYRRAAGTAYAVDRDGIRALHCAGRGCEWRELDLTQAPLVRRAMRLLVEKAWRYA